MFKRLALLLFFFCVSFASLSLRIQGTPLFTHLDQMTYPLALKSRDFSEELLIKGYHRFVAWNNKKREVKNPSLTMIKNRYGHQTYSAQEKEQLLELLSGAVQKNN